MFHKAFGKLMLFVVPVIVLVVLMIMSFSPQKALFIAILTLLGMGLVMQLFDKESTLRKAPVIFLKKTLEGFASGGKTVAGIAVCMATMGCVVEILTATGCPPRSPSSRCPWRAIICSSWLCWWPSSA